MKLTKAELSTRICEKAHVPKDDAIKLVDTMFEIIKASLERGEPVKLKNFGNFNVRFKKARKGRNPKNGAEIIIPERKVLAFKASAIAKKTVATLQD